MNLFKQSKNNTKFHWLGAVQVQITSTFFYVSVVNTILLAITFWYTAGYRIQRFVPWANIWIFLGSAIVLFLIVMIIDFKFILPARQAFQNEQACKHENPAMDSLNRIEADLKLIKKEMGIK